MKNRDTMTLWRAVLPDLLTACGLIAAPFILPLTRFCDRYDERVS